MWIVDSLDISRSSEKLEFIIVILYIVLKAHFWSLFFEIIWLTGAAGLY